MMSRIGLFTICFVVMLADCINAQDRIPVRDVVTLVETIEQNEVFEASHLRIEQWPVELIPEGAASSIDEIVGKQSQTRLTRNDIVNLENVIARPHGFRIPKGKRVIAIPVSGDLGKILPGDAVDVVGVFSMKADGGKEIAKRVLEKVDVFSVSSGQRRSVIGLMVDLTSAEKLISLQKASLEIRVVLRPLERDPNDLVLKSRLVGDQQRLEGVVEDLRRLASELKQLNRIDESRRIDELAEQLLFKDRVGE